MLTHWTCVIPPCPVCTVWSVFTTSDLFCKNWHFGIERFKAPHSVALWKGQLSLKKSVRPADTLRVRETRERERDSSEHFGWMYNRFLLCVDLVWAITVSGLCWTELLSSTGCCNLFSAWPDYCLLHIVWWRAAGWRDGRRSGGREGGGSDSLLHKEDYLFINVSIWTFAIFSCFSSLFICV